MFLTSMAFLANGSDTVILPRWRLEGPSAWMLSAYFLEQLPKNSTSAEAWRRAVLRFASDEIRIESEPRIGKSDDIERVKGTHPLFWAGYILIDSGSGSLREKERLMSPEDAAETAEAAENAPADGRNAQIPGEIPPASAKNSGLESDDAENPNENPVSPVNNGPLAPLPPMGGSGVPGASGIPMGGNAVPVLE